MIRLDPINGFIGFLLIIVVCFAYLGVGSTRGTDQFWYLSDTETLLSDGGNHSNLTMPGVVLRQNNGTPSTPFYHNGPLLYINAYASKITGVTPFTVWKINNFIFSLIAALLIALMVAQVTSRQTGFYALAIYVLSPLNVWLTVNLLQETFYAFLFAIQLYVTTRNRQTYIGLIVLLISLVVGAYSHPFFKIIMLTVGVIFVVQKRQTIALGVFICFALVVVTEKLFFPTSFPPDLKSLIAYSVPGKSNSLWHQSDFILSVTPDLLYRKVVRAVTIQFSDYSIPVLSMFTYFSIPAFCLLVLKKFTSITKILWLSFIAFTLYLGIVVLMQYQVRYQQIIAPSSISLVMLSMFICFKKNVGKLMLFLALVCSVVDIKLVATAGADASSFASSGQRFAELIERYPDNFRIVFVDNKELGSYQYLVRTLKPRQVMVLGVDWLSENSRKRSIDLFQPDLLFYSESALDTLKLEGDKLQEFSTFHKVGKLYYEVLTGN